MAKEIETIFTLTSASNGEGINLLFNRIGYKLFNQNDGDNKSNKENNKVNIINNNNHIKKKNKTEKHKLKKKEKENKCC